MAVKKSKKRAGFSFLLKMVIKGRGAGLRAEAPV